MLSLLFYIKNSKVNKAGKTSVNARITIDGVRSEFSIGHQVPTDKWESKTGKMAGFSAEAKILNRHIETVSNKIYECYNQIMSEQNSFTATDVRDKYLGKDKKQKMLLEIFQTHNDQAEALIGKDFAAGTIERYKTAKKHVQAFLEHEYHKKDIPVKCVDNKFITGFEYFLKTNLKCAHNTSLKYIANFKKIVRLAYANDWIDKDPFVNYKAKLRPVIREYLTEEEIQTLADKTFKTARLELVKDIFLFSCFTGLAYCDVQKISSDDIIFGIDGHKWIKTTRTKTKTTVSIPVLPTAMVIIEKYKTHPEVLIKGLLLPILTNQKMNAYLKEIADLCKINKNLTFHVARHTFATTVTLTNGVPIESVSKMLGHKSLKTTQHYAKILDRKVSDDMNILRERMKEKHSFLQNETKK